jgi:AraC family ethanolamine operon transcriptional activator
MTMISVQLRKRTNERIVDACVQLAADRQYHGVTMTALCRASGVSERRVRHAFDECFGVSPMSYLRAAALRDVQRSLVERPFGRDAVTRAASDFGFTHLSRFAGHYRELFGESPRETVSRARRFQSIENQARTWAS